MNIVPSMCHTMNSPILLSPQGPQRSKTSSSQKVKNRMKDQRLQGSDLYVARLCWKETEEPSPLLKCNETQVAAQKGIDLPSDRDRQPVQRFTGSLHDELRCRKPTKCHSNARSAQSPSKKPMATQSHPCYRCVAYMSTAGIKRVFWTNAKGEWEGAKVQELVDALEGSSPSIGCRKDGANDQNELFVTKHEVLMLRKSMGQ